MRIDNLQNYTPARHGEQGVDATLHTIIKESKNLSEVFCNPPGGSWTEFDICNPSKDKKFRWDHIPRQPSGVKRPDQVIQHCDNDFIEMLSVESKYDKSDLKPDIGQELDDYLTGNSEFPGLIIGPAWHKQKNESEGWEVIPEDGSDAVRYWLRDYSAIETWTGFAFANISSQSDQPFKQNTEEIRTDMEAALSESDIDVVFTVSWTPERGFPKLYMMQTDEFKSSPVGIALSQSLEIHNSDTTIL